MQQMNAVSLAYVLSIIIVVAVVAAVVGVCDFPLV